MDFLGLYSVGIGIIPIIFLISRVVIFP